MDAEALKYDERERQKLAEKLKKYTSTVGKSEIPAQGNIELVELSVRNSDVIEVELSLWDRILIFIMSIFGISSSSEYKKNKALEELKRKLKRNKPVMVDFSRGYLSENFAKIIFSLYDYAKLLRSIFDVFIDNENFWKGIGVEKSSCEYLFENITDLPNVVERYKEINNEFIQKIVDKSQSVKSAINIVEEEINFVLRSIPEDVIKRADSLFNNIMKVREFVYFDFETIVRRFTQVSELKGGKLSFKSISPQGLTNHLRDLESILLSLDVDDVYTANYIKIMIDYVEKYAGGSVDKLKELKEKIGQGFFQTINDNIRKLNIVDLVAYITRDPTHKPFVIKTNYSLFKEFSKVLTERYKNLTVAMMEEKNSKLVEKYVNIMFGKPIEILEYGIYSSNINSLFSKYGIPKFLYTKLLVIASRFIKDVWDVYLKDIVNTLVVSGSFSEKQLQRTLSEIITKVESYKVKMNDFIKAVDQGGEYYILLSRFISNPSILSNEGNKKIVERKVIIINGVCFEFMNAFKDLFRGMYKILSFIVEDIYAPFPKTVVNIHRLKGASNREFIESLEKSVEKINAFSSLVALFVEE
ncbi:MAG: DUF5312 family protein [Brevinematia bacterium]